MKDFGKNNECSHLSEQEYIQIIEAVFYKKKDETARKLYEKIKHCPECISVVRDGWISLLHLDAAMNESEMFADKFDTKIDELFANDIHSKEEKEKHPPKSPKPVESPEPRKTKKENIPKFLFSAGLGMFVPQEDGDTYETYQEKEKELATVYRAEDDTTTNRFSFQSKLHPSHIFLVEARVKINQLNFKFRLKCPQESSFISVALQEKQKKDPFYVISCPNNFYGEFFLSLKNPSEYFFTAIDKNNQKEILFYLSPS